jgi:hypothetical protein
MCSMEETSAQSPSDSIVLSAAPALPSAPTTAAKENVQPESEPVVKLVALVVVRLLSP